MRTGAFAVTVMKRKKSLSVALHKDSVQWLTVLIGYCNLVFAFIVFGFIKTGAFRRLVK
jgi:hypothetical protein